MKINQPAQHLENTLEISDTLPSLGEIVDILIPVVENPEQDERLDVEFQRYPVNLSPEEREGHKLASKIGRLGNPVIRATLSLLG